MTKWLHCIEGSFPWYHVEWPYQATSDAPNCNLLREAVGSTSREAAESPWASFDEHCKLHFGPYSHMVSACKSHQTTNPTNSGKSIVASPLGTEKWWQALKPSHKHHSANLPLGAVLNGGKQAPSRWMHPSANRTMDCSE